MLNPILALELRARWRGARSFLLILGVALALSCVAVFVYQRAFEDTERTVFNPATVAMRGAITYPSLRAAAIGRELFVALAHANILIWLLLAAASTAPNIARERERGLLESLQLSRMGAWSQLGARLGAGLLLLAALQLVLLPIYSVAFLMGGVSPGEIARAFGLVGASSALGTAAGLWFSARSHRPTNALFSALGALALWSGWAYLNAMQRPFYNGLDFGLLHPNALFWALTAANSRAANSQPLLFIAGALWLGVGALLMWSAARQITRALAPPSWQANSRLVEKLRQKQAASGRSHKASGALVADLPLDGFVRFSDPLLAREVKARFRLRRAGFWTGLVRFALFIGAASVWLFQVFWFTDAQTRVAVTPLGLRALLYGGVVCAGVLAATSWTRERESGTWESLKLSLLSPREVLRAKWRSPLISLAYYSAPLWILMVVGAPFLGLELFVPAFFIVMAWLGLATALGLWVSWRARNGTAAIAWTLGILMTLLAGLPWLNSMAGVDEALMRWRYGSAPIRLTGGRLIMRTANGRRIFSPSPVDDALQWRNRLWSWHPGETLNRLFYHSDMMLDPTRGWRGRRYYVDENLASVGPSLVLPLVAALALMALLRRDVRREQLNG